MDNPALGDPPVLFVRKSPDQNPRGPSHQPAKESIPEAGCFATGKPVTAVSAMCAGTY